VLTATFGSFDAALAACLTTSTCNAVYQLSNGNQYQGRGCNDVHKSYGWCKGYPTGATWQSERCANQGGKTWFIKKTNNGEKGAVGDKGIKGERGAQGLQGAQGAQGDNGYVTQYGDDQYPL
jgi:hypothetical protein